MVYDPMFGQEVTVFCNQSIEAYNKWEKTQGVEDTTKSMNPNFSAFSTQYSTENEASKYVIWVNQFNWTLDDQASLIHEVIHIVFRIWGANNIPFCPETQEFLAASVDKLYSSIAAKIMVRDLVKSNKIKGIRSNKDDTSSKDVPGE